MRLNPRFSRSIFVAALAAALCPAGAYAQDTGTPLFSLSGFGTLGVVHSSEDRADFTNSIFKPNGAGYSESWSAGVDSRIGAQLTSTPTARLWLVVQVIAEQTFDGTYTPHLEWANIKYKVTPDFSVRIGRTELPAFLLTDTIEVGYTYPWVRPPPEVYRVLPVTNSDGLDLAYTFRAGEVINIMQALIGRNDTSLPHGEGRADSRRSWGVTDTVEYGALTVRMTYQKTYLTTGSLDALFDAFRPFGPQGVAIANTYDSDAKPFAAAGLGASYYPGQWFAMSEWAHADAHSYYGKRTAWYVSGGYRCGNFTPYVTYAAARANNLSDPGLTVSAYPAALAGPASALNAALNTLLRERSVQHTVSIGARWDFMKDADLKLQFDRTRIGAGSDGVLINIQPDFQPGGSVNLFSAVIDFFFK
jgi:hypothetical protein